MTNPRRRALLPQEERAKLQNQELAREGSWEPLLVFSLEKNVGTPENPVYESVVVPGVEADDEPPFAHAHSLMDTPHQGHLILEHTDLWSGGLRLTISDGENETKFMLHSRQLETLMTVVERWNKGFAQDYLQKKRGEQ